MYEGTCSSIGFGKLLSIFSFCAPTHSVSLLRRTSVISQYNRFPLMYELRGKRWPKYITNIYLGELSYQGHREVPETDISNSCTKSFMRIPCSIKWNTSSFTRFNYIIQYGRRGHAYFTMVDKRHKSTMMSLQYLEVMSQSIAQYCATMVIEVVTEGICPNPQKLVRILPCEYMS